MKDNYILPGLQQNWQISQHWGKNQSQIHLWFGEKVPQ